MIGSLFVRIILTFLFVFTTSSSKADDNFKRWNSYRDYEPVVLSAEQLPDLIYWSVNKLFVYAYDSTAQSWHPIPFQIDEKDYDSTGLFLPNPNGEFDRFDEICFMARDMGDQAPDDTDWIDNNDSRERKRIEIAATDTLDGGKRAFAYIYISNTLTPDPNMQRYVSYRPDMTGGGADTVIASTYIEGHNTGGIPDHLKLPGGTGMEILDRQKVRINAVFGGIVPLIINEGLLENKDATKIELLYKVGPVRVLRYMIWDITLMTFNFKFRYPLKYYPYNLTSGAVQFNIPTTSNIVVNSFRFSFDYNSSVVNMKFLNAKNQAGVTIDGVGGDEIVDSPMDVGKLNWFMISGDPGSIVYLYQTANIGSSREIYYYDNSASNNDDTGDKKSYGDSGILIKGNPVNYMNFNYQAHYFGSNRTYDVGESIAENLNAPLKLEAQASTWVVPVELASFTAEVTRGDVQLSWTTLSESNSYGFEIQRCSEGISDWSKIRFIEGRGSTQVPFTYSYTDRNLKPGTYSYRLKQIDFDGSFEYFQHQPVTVTAPKDFVLEQNYPNPFNPETRITYELADKARVNLAIYTVTGERVKTLVSEEQNAGFYTAAWNGLNDGDEAMPTGIYFYKLTAGTFTATKRMVFLK